MKENDRLHWVREQGAVFQEKLAVIRIVDFAIDIYNRV